MSECKKIWTGLTCECRCDCNNDALEGCHYCFECGGSTNEQKEKEERELNKIALMRATGAL